MAAVESVSGESRANPPPRHHSPHQGRAAGRLPRLHAIGSMSGDDAYHSYC
jgi:hypothetical protein